MHEVRDWFSSGPRRNRPKGEQKTAQGFSPHLYTQVDGVEHYGGMKIRCGLVAQ
jgi:hypothetical protein